MTCNEAQKIFLALDNGQNMPSNLAEHLGACPTCARQVAIMQSVFDALLAEGSVELAPGSLEAVMHAVCAAAEGVTDEEPLSVAKWLVAGGVIFAGTVLVRFSNSHTWLSQVFGTSLELPLSIILGAVVTIYASLFIGTHVDQVATFFGLRRH